MHVQSLQLCPWHNDIRVPELSSFIACVQAFAGFETCTFLALEMYTVATWYTCAFSIAIVALQTYDRTLLQKVRIMQICICLVVSGCSNSYSILFSVFKIVLANHVKCTQTVTGTNSNAVRHLAKSSIKNIHICSCPFWRTYLKRGSPRNPGW